MFARRRQAIADRFERAHAARFSLGVNGIVVGAEPIHLHASNTHAALLIHGFNDTPQSLSVLAGALHGAGWSVYAPLLPGHGRDLPTMAATSRADAWISCVRDEYARLRATYRAVTLCGLSMGGALCSMIAADSPELPALVLLAPYIGMPWTLQAQLPLAWIAQQFSPYLQGAGGERSLHDDAARARALNPGVNTAYALTGLRTVARAAERALPRVHAPTLYMQSREDNRIRAADADRHFATIGAREKEQQWLTGCGHIITADFCRDEVAQRTIAWMNRFAGRPIDR